MPSDLKDLCTLMNMFFKVIFVVTKHSVSQKQMDFYRNIRDFQGHKLYGNRPLSPFFGLSGSVINGQKLWCKCDYVLDIVSGLFMVWHKNSGLCCWECCWESRKSINLLRCFSINIEKFCYLFFLRLNYMQVYIFYGRKLGFSTFWIS